MKMKDMKKAAIIFVAILIASSLTGCIKKEKNEDNEDTNTQAKIEWMSYEDGMEEANKTGKPVLLYFYKNESNIFSSHGIIQKSKDFVMIKINASSNESVESILSLYNVSTFPTVIIISGEDEIRLTNPTDGEILSQMDKLEKEGEIEWMSYEEGMEEANKTGKPVLLYFCYSSAPLCKYTDEKIFSDKNVIKKSKNFVMINVDVGDEKNKNIVFRYRLQYIMYNYQNNYYPYLPTVIFLKNGEILHRLITYDVYDPNNPTKSVKDFLENMDKALKGDIWGYDFDFVTLDGKTKHLRDYRGKVVLVDLMATWCQPCRMQMAELKKVLQHYGKSKIAIISIDVEKSDTPQKIKSTFGDHINEWTFGMDKYGLAEKFWVMSIPTLAIFDKYGRLQYLRPGLTQANELEKIIDEIK